MESTFTMIKPDAVARGETGRILARMEAAGFRVRRLKLVRLHADEARRFYQVHEGKPFLDRLVAYMCSGPVVAAVLERENAIQELRRLVGATDPSQADPGTIRREFGVDKSRNAVHASDGPQTAAEEIAFFGLTQAREGGQ